MIINSPAFDSVLKRGQYLVCLSIEIYLIRKGSSIISYSDTMRLNGWRGDVDSFMAFD